MSSVTAGYKFADFPLYFDAFATSAAATSSGVKMAIG